MRWTYTLCRIAGIALNVHLTTWLAPVLFGWAYGARGLIVVACVYTCVTLHELCHALQARRCGLQVSEIVLWPIGGVAQIRSFGHRPAQEFSTALAGPLFNFASAALLFVPVLHWLGPETLLHRDVLLRLSLETWPQTFASCFWLNPLLGLFNLVPAFPMDGGRLLRSALAWRLSYGRATQIAARLGQVCAVGFAGWGVLGCSPPNLLVVLIGLFVFWGASQEHTAVEARAVLEPLRVGDIVGRAPAALEAGAPAQSALEAVLHDHQPAVPVVEGDRFEGLVPRAAVLTAMREGRLQRPVGELVRRDVPRLHPEESLLRAYQAMESLGCHALPVVRDGRLEGIVTLEDVRRVHALMASGAASDAPSVPVEA